MFARQTRWIVVLSITFFVAIWALHGSSGQVSAAQAYSGAGDSACMTCHENLYYLYDTGKWYCITELKDRCVNCHAGDPGALKADAAHLGLFRHPQEKGDEKCRQCHGDSQARLAKFGSVAGYKPVVQTISYEPASPPLAGFPDIVEPESRTAKWPWFVGSIFFFGLWLVFVLRTQ